MAAETDPNRPATPTSGLSKYLTFAEAGASLPHPVSGAAIWRWCSVGLVVGGRRLRLRGYKFGRRMYTTMDDVEEFADRLAKAELEEAERLDAQSD